MKMKAVIVIDFTNDFVATDGRLTCGEPAQAVDARIAAITNEAIQQGDYVVYATDVHFENDPYHPETKLFPPHNIAGTSGRHLYGQTGEVYNKHVGKNNVVWLDKTRYSAFCGTTLETELRARNITEVHLVGVCTDICVLHTAVDAYNKGYSIVVHADAVASFNPAGHDWALGHFSGTLGAQVVGKK
ncbi:MAG: cysteine hydrolase family protein [Bacilli bacterium]